MKKCGRPIFSRQFLKLSVSHESPHTSTHLVANVSTSDRRDTQILCRVLFAWTKRASQICPLRQGKWTSSPIHSLPSPCLQIHTSRALHFVCPLFLNIYPGYQHSTFTISEEWSAHSKRIIRSHSWWVLAQSRYVDRYMWCMTTYSCVRQPREIFVSISRVILVYLYLWRRLRMWFRYIRGRNVAAGPSRDHH